MKDRILSHCSESISPLRCIFSRMSFEFPQIIVEDPGNLLSKSLSRQIADNFLIAFFVIAKVDCLLAFRNELQRNNEGGYLSRTKHWKRCAEFILQGRVVLILNVKTFGNRTRIFSRIFFNDVG